MKTKIIAMIIAVSTFVSTAAIANPIIVAADHARKVEEKQMALQMEKGWNSPECIFSAEAGELELRGFAMATLLPGADKNQAMLIEALDFKDTLIATQMVVCEGKTAKEALTFVGL